jgi:nucleotide-binding universal stress UspA family protein
VRQDDRARQLPEVATVTVLLAYISTPEGDAALAAAVDEAKRRATDAVVVNVTRPAEQVGPEFSTEQLLDGAARRFGEAGIAVEVRQLPGGVDTADAIVAVADEINPDLVVIGLRRRTAVGKLIVGSTSQRILLGVACPVLAVKAPH